MKRYVIAIVGAVVMMVLLAAQAGTLVKENEPIAPKEKMMLWNGEDFTGWKFVLREPGHDVTKTWSVRNGIIRCEGKPTGYMRTEKDYTNYLFHVEWRWTTEAGNSGVLVHMSGPDKVWPKSLECQMYAGYAGDILVIGEGKGYLIGVQVAERAKGGPRVKGRIVRKLKESSERPTGQWNSYDIICKNDWAVLLVNGVLQNVVTKCTITSGKICLQSEGRPVEFRNIYIEPLE
jgi:hypothetical protein